MKVTKAVVILVALLMGVEALKCRVCKAVKEDDEVNEGKSTACDDASIEECGDVEDACVTTNLGFTAGVGALTIKTEETDYACGATIRKDTDEAVCKSFETTFSQLPGFKDFKCSTKYCETDLCSAGRVAQISGLILATSIVLFGLLF